MSRWLTVVVALFTVQLLVQGEPLQADNPPAEWQRLTARGQGVRRQSEYVIDNPVVEADGGKSSSEDDDKPGKPCKYEYDEDEETMGGKSKDKDNNCKKKNDDTWWIVLVSLACAALVFVSILSVVAYKCKKPRTTGSQYCRRASSMNSVRPDPYDKSNDKDDSYIRPPAGTPPPSRTPPPPHTWSEHEGGVNPAAGPPPYMADVPKYSSIA